MYLGRLEVEGRTITVEGEEREIVGCFHSIFCHSICSDAFVALLYLSALTHNSRCLVTSISGSVCDELLYQ